MDAARSDLAPRTGFPHPNLIMLARLALLAAALAVMIVVARNWEYWRGLASVQRTDDAYLAADLTPMGARVQGLVRAVPVADYQRVHAGDVLVQIDDRDYRAQVALAQADLDAAKAQLATVLAQRSLQQANVAAAENAIVSAQAITRRDQEESGRQRSLLASGLTGTRQKVEQVEAAAASSAADLLRVQAQLKGAQAQFEVLDAQEKQARAAIEGKGAALDVARINLGYTTITAPADGEVGLRMVRPGQYVGVGTQVNTLIALPQVWVLANYKETQLVHVAPGQRATITVDGLADAALHGHVESISPGSGSQFSLLPPDNASGNFTKVVQRITVKIVLDDADGVADRLRPGMSVIASNDTRTP